MKLLLAVLAAFAVVKTRTAEPNIWAVLVAGSNYYYNYRHQADVCHAYQILHKHGVPDERIIVLMYDDIANNEENPVKGNIINHANGPNVYEGIVKDYVKDTVTPDTFLKILNGEVPKGGSGKTLKSTSADHVFVNFVDHGAPGLLAFPGEAPVLTVKDFITTLKKMAKENKFAKMVIYVEACESGSMFQGHLPDNIKIFATTAANPDESSFACYYDNKRETYLGDWYSVNWMEDTDKENIQKETLEDQFLVTKNLTTMSHVMQYGQKDIAKMSVGEFQGHKKTEPTSYPQMPVDAVKSYDVPIKILERKILATKDVQKKMELAIKLKVIMENRLKLKTQMYDMANKVSTDGAQSLRITGKQRPLVDIDCHDQVVKHFDRHCLSYSQNTYAMRFVYMLVNMCEEKIPVPTIIEKIDAACAPLKAANGYYL